MVVTEIPASEQLLLQMGSGRYGSFVERFVLPDAADRGNIQAGYERGMLGRAVLRLRQLTLEYCTLKYSFDRSYRELCSEGQCFESQWVVHKQEVSICISMW